MKKLMLRVLWRLIDWLGEDYSEFTDLMAQAMWRIQLDGKSKAAIDIHSADEHGVMLVAFCPDSLTAEERLGLSILLQETQPVVMSQEGLYD